MLVVQLLVLLAYSVLVTVWFVSVKKNKSLMLILGSTAILSAGPFFFSLGMLFGSFDGNSCYSNSIEKFSKFSAQVAQSRNSNEIEKLNTLIKKLPLYGYETNCEELEKVISEYVPDN